MKKPIIFSVFFFIITAIPSFGQSWLIENVDPETGLRTGLIRKGFFGQEIIEIKPNSNLRRVELRDFDLRNVNLQGANLSNADLFGSDIKGANIEGTNLENAELRNISSGNLKGSPSALPDGYKIINGFLVGPGVNLYDADLQGADLQGMNLSYVRFSSANLEGANLTGTKLDNVYWNNVNGTPSTFPEGYSIIKGYLVGPNTNLKRANLEGANLDGLNLDGADLEGANLKNASLINTSLKNARLLETDFSGANLEGASLRDSTLHKGNEFWSIRKETLGGQGFNEEAIFSDANLRGVDFGGTSFIINGSNISAFISANIAENYKSIKALQAKIVEGEGGGISIEQAAAITSNTESVNEVKNAIFIGGSSIIPALLTNDQEQRNSITANTTKIEELDGILKTADETLEAFSQNLNILNENDQSIGEQLTALGQNDISIGEQMTKLGENDQSIMAEINAMKAQLQTLVASVAEKDAQIAEKDAEIAELKQGGGGQSLEQVLEQVRDARAGSVVLTVDPEGDTVTLGLTIEQSDNLIEWTKLEGEITRTIPIPDGKKFFRFALDKGAQKEVHDPGHLDPPIDPPLEF